MKSIFLKNQLTLIALMLFSLSACGGGNSPGNDSASANQGQGATNATSTSNPLSPGNLPPPGSTPSAQSENDMSSSSQFFARKQLWDSFSEPLKAQIMKSYNAKLSGPGPGGIGYFNTLFGRVSPKKVGSSQSALLKDQGHFLKSGQRMYLMDYVSGQDVATQYCNFLCLDSPQDNLNTVYDSVIIAGRVNMSKAAGWAPTDPVLMISVFKQIESGSETVAQDIPVYGTEVASTPVSPPSSSSGSGSESQPAQQAAPEDIGTFGKTVPLTGPGAYTVVITSFQKDESGNVSENSKYFTIYRQDIPTIEVLTITPPSSGNQAVSDPAHRNDPLKKDSDTLKDKYDSNMTAVDLVVKVTTAAKSKDALDKNVGILFQNYDDQNILRYSSSGARSFNTLPDADQTPIKKAELPLFNGENNIVIISHNQQLDDFYESMGLTPPPPQKIQFLIKNTLPSVQIKLLSPQDGSVVEPATSNESVKISFCMTDLPKLRDMAATQPGQCIANWNGDQPVVKFNALQYGKDASYPLSYDATSGIYSIQTQPVLGSNTIQISVANKNYIPPIVTTTTDNTDPQNPKTTTQTTNIDLGSLSASFLYGKMNKIIENGKLNETDNLLKRGISLQINRNIITHDLKKMLEKYLNQDSFKQGLRDIFRKNDSGPSIVCTKTGSLSIDHGDTSINFLEEGFSVGNIVVNKMEPNSDNRFWLDVTVQGLHGEADLRGFNVPMQVQIGGKDASFVPISVYIKEIRARIAVRFEKEDGINKLRIEKQSDGSDAVTLIGDGPMGNVAHVNSTRNPLAAGLEAYDAQTGLLSKSFADTLQSTVLCGVEGGLNNKESGLPRWDADLLKLVSYNNQNPFRISTEFELLNKTIGLDIAYDILRGDIKFAYNGIVISNIPLRFTPSPKILGDLMNQYTSGILGSLSMPFQAKEAPPSLPGTDENKNISLSLSEDAINQALFAASAAGVLNLDIDPNFYSSHGNNFISLALPSVKGMFPITDNLIVDFNHNGVQDDEDLPVLLRVRPDPAYPPALHFLNKDEVKTLANQIKKARTGDDQSVLNEDLHIFRLSISNLELAFYLEEAISKSQGGFKSFCSASANEVSFADSELKRGKVDPIFVMNNMKDKVDACSQSVSRTYESPDGTCATHYDTPFTTPVKNGAIISAVPGQADAPVVRMKVNLVVYGALQGVYREVLAADKYDLSPTDGAVGVKKDSYSATTFARIKILNYQSADKGEGPGNLSTSVTIVENHTSGSSKDLTEHLIGTILNSALNTDCQYFNEIRIPIPDSFLKDKSTLSDSLKQTLQDFGLDYINLGLGNDQVPEIPYNDGVDASSPVSNPLYLDLKAHLGLCMLGDTCN